METTLIKDPETTENKELLLANEVFLNIFELYIINKL